MLFNIIAFHFYIPGVYFFGFYDHLVEIESTCTRFFFGNVLKRLLYMVKITKVANSER